MANAATPTVIASRSAPGTSARAPTRSARPSRREVEYGRKLKAYRELGFDAVQFHDDDIVPADLDWPSHAEGGRRGQERCSTARVCSSRSSPRGSGKTRARSTARSPRTARATASTPSTAPAAAVDIAREVGCKNYVLWLAREGTYIREAKDAQDRRRPDRRRLERDPRARPGDPDPRRGQAQRADGPGLPADRRPHDRRLLQDDRPGPLGRPDRDAHSILAGLDPADDMAYAL